MDTAREPAAPDVRTPDELLHALTEHPVLRTLDDVTRRAVVDGSRIVQFRARRSLLRAGVPPEHVLVVLRGTLRAFHRSAEGEEVLLRLYRAQALVGTMEVLAQTPVLEFVSAVEATDVLRIPAALFRHLATTRAAFAHGLAQQLSQYLYTTSCAERALAFCDVDSRLARLLLDYLELGSESQGAQVRLKLPLTQQMLAADLGVTRKSVSRALDKLRKERVFRKEGRWYVVEDVAALRARSLQLTGLVVP